MAESFSKWRSEVFTWAVTAVVAGSASFFAWSAVSILNRPTRDEVTSLIESNTPYMRDKKAIDQRLEAFDRMQDTLTQVIDRNTEAIIDLRIQLSTFKHADQ